MHCAPHGWSFMHQFLLWMASILNQSYCKDINIHQSWWLITTQHGIGAFIMYCTLLVVPASNMKKQAGIGLMLLLLTYMYLIHQKTGTFLHSLLSLFLPLSQLVLSFFLDFLFFFFPSNSFSSSCFLLLLLFLLIISDNYFEILIRAAFDKQYV